MYFLFTGQEYVIFFETVQKFFFSGFPYCCHFALYISICMSCV
jgi:hypothetical protein